MNRLKGFFMGFGKFSFHFIIFFLFFQTSLSFSSEFRHLKLDPDYENYLTQKRSKSILGQNSYQKDILPPSENEESPLYQEIRRYLESIHQSLGQREVEDLNRFNERFDLGTSNFSGFSWQRPFGVIQVHADRQVTPNIFGDNWLVMDTFNFQIEATTLLEKLKEADLLLMETSEIAAFAGITFKRTYTYWHYAPNYQEGLTSDFSKLFLPFLKFNENFSVNLGDDEILKREDSWTVAAGGLITSPPFHNISFSGGVLTETNHQKTTSLQKSTGEEKPFKIGVQQKKSSTTELNLELQLDFFKLIKLSLLRYDLNYENSSEGEYSLAFHTADLEEVKKSPSKNQEFHNLIQGQNVVQYLIPYAQRVDESSSLSRERGGHFLLWGSLKKQKTEKIRVVKDQEAKIFFKNYSQTLKTIQNIFSNFLPAAVFKLLKLPFNPGNMGISSRQVTMEYEASQPQSIDHDFLRVEGTEKFSLLISQYYQSPRTDRWIDQRFKKDVINFVKNYTTLSSAYEEKIQQETLRGPFYIESLVRVDQEGINFLLERNEDEVFLLLSDICQSEMKLRWAQRPDREELMNKRLRGKEKCVKEMGRSFLEFKNDYHRNFSMPSMVKFKFFITQFYRTSKNLREISDLFGEENIFIHGRLQSKTSSQLSYSTSFSTGQFRGMGVIDNFKRVQKSELPASITSD